MPIHRLMKGRKEDTGGASLNDIQRVHPRLLMRWTQNKPSCFFHGQLDDSFCHQLASKPVVVKSSTGQVLLNNYAT